MSYMLQFIKYVYKRYNIYTDQEQSKMAPIRQSLKIPQYPLLVTIQLYSSEKYNTFLKIHFNLNKTVLYILTLNLSQYSCVSIHWILENKRDIQCWL